MGVAEFVEVEQFGRKGLAARMALTLVLIDVDFQLAGHGDRSLGLTRMVLRRAAFLMLIWRREAAGPDAL